MESLASESTAVGLGFGIQSDPFQSGREAAQMARSQAARSDSGIVLAVAPSTVHFQDFCEGVRLVTGENALIGVPAARVVSTDLCSPFACMVALIGSPSMRFSLASAAGEGVDFAVTSLLSSFRQSRGNNLHQFEHQGLLIFHNASNALFPALPRALTAECGYQPWLLSSAPVVTQPAGIVCRDQTLATGAVAIECLSEMSWGVSAVSIGAFRHHRGVLTEAVKSVLREAVRQMDERRPAFGFLFFNNPISDLPPQEFEEIMAAAQTITKEAPLVGIVSERAAAFSPRSAPLDDNDSVVALLVP